MKKLIFTFLLFTNYFVFGKNNFSIPPAEVLNFSYECGYLKWSTSYEKNCDHFLILFSRNGKDWNIIGQIHGAGNSNLVQKYKYPTDLKDVYFKMYQVDFDGSSKEYGAIYAKCEKL